MTAPQSISPNIEPPAGCICQDRHRRGYCTEPGCPYSDPEIMKARALQPATPTATGGDTKMQKEAAALADKIAPLIKRIEALEAVHPVQQAPEPTPEMINAAAREMWNDRDARHGGPWDSRDAGEVCVIQTRATARAALKAALSIPSAEDK